MARGMLDSRMPMKPVSHGAFQTSSPPNEKNKKLGNPGKVSCLCRAEAERVGWLVQHRHTSRFFRRPCGRMLILQDRGG